MSTSTAKPIVKITDLSLVYNPGKSTEFQALKNINLEILPEEFVIFYGPSGSGKSTLLYIIAGLETPTKGVVSVAGRADIAKLNEKELIEYHRTSVGMIFQAFYLIPSLTARDNVLLPMVFRGTDPAKRAEAADKLLDRFGITTFKDRTPARLSGGQQQRVAIARSLINDPEIVLADEPVGNLDSKNSEIVLELIKDLHTRDKKTVILVTHDPRHLPHADRVFYIKDGEVVRMVKQKPTPSDKPATNENPEAAADHLSLLDKLALLYPNFDESRLKAKLLVNFILLPYDFQVLEKVEQLVADYLTKKITEQQLLDKLDLAPEVGGVGLYKQTATKLITEVNKLATEITQLEKGGKKPSGDAQLIKAKQVIQFALKNFDGKLSEIQVSRLIAAVKLRLLGTYTKDDLLEVMDKSLSDEGVGMDRRAAEHLVQQIELVLMQEKI
jgi:putative ABC transport system ATP-binding protein